MPRVMLPHPPQERDQQWWAINAILGVTIPRTKVCSDPCEPLDVFADANLWKCPIPGLEGPISRAAWHACVPGGTQVTTTLGPKSIQDIQRGEQVLGWADGKLAYGRVNNCWISSSSAEVYALRTRAGRLRATANHRVLICRKYKGRPGDGIRRRPPNEWREEFVELADVRVGDFLVQPYDYAEVEAAAVGPGLDEELAEWLGLICGDGFIRVDHVKTLKYGIYDTYQVMISHHRDAAYMDHYRNFVRDRYGKEMHYAPQNRVNRLTSRAAYDDARWFEGKRAHTKQVPPELWTSSRAAVLAFLRGYTDADGTVRTKDGSIEWGSVSKQLLDQVRHLCLLHGLQVGVVSPGVKAGPYHFYGRLTQRRDFYSLRCYDGVKIGSNDPKYDFGILRRPRTISNRNGWAAPQPRDCRRFLRVLGVEALPAEEVWDLEVEGTESFVADSFVVHNSRG